MDFNLKLSEHFKLLEFVESQAAARNGIDNTPPEFVIINLKLLCLNLLEPIRDYFAAPLIVTSGFRCFGLNQLIGGVSTSQHTKGQAVDFHIVGHSDRDIFNWIRYVSKLSFDQLILEFPDAAGWLHISYASPGRHQVLVAHRRNGHIVYLPAEA